jgi:hypothetical protein
MTSGTVTLGGSPDTIPAGSVRASSKVWSGGNGRYETVSGVVRPKWNNYTLRKKLRYNSSNAKITGRYRDSPADMSWSPFDQGVPLFTLSSLGTIVPAFSAMEILKLQSKLVDKAKGHSFNLSVATAESGKAMEMILGTIGGFTRAMQAIKRGDMVTAARRLGINDYSPRKSLDMRDLGSRWLELQYGWKPLVADCYAGFDAWHNIAKRPRTVTFRVATNKTASRKQNSSLYQINWSQQRRRTITFEMSEQLSAPRSLGLMDPLTVAWELMPYSFVVDWFVPIGAYLHNYNQVPNLKGRFMTTEVLYHQGITLGYIPNGTFGPPKIVEYTNQPSIKYTDTNVTRTVTTSLDVPRPFSWNRDALLNPIRFANALALMRTAFKPANYWN